MSDTPPPHADQPYGAQTRLAVDNFQFGGGPVCIELISAMVLIKLAAARVIGRHGWRPASRMQAVAEAAQHLHEQLAAGQLRAAFPVDLYQTGSGTSTHMNVNEVIAHFARERSDESVHPNDDVNFAQSSNDVFPAAIRVAALLLHQQRVEPALLQLQQALEHFAGVHADTVKTARTHLMDAVPMTVGQEFSGYAAQLQAGRARLHGCVPRLAELPLGGTAVGTGLNAPAEFASAVCAELTDLTGISLRPASNRFEAQSCIDTFSELGAQHKVVAGSLFKLANDLRWLASGPLAGLGELRMPALQAGSSIMPGKVNPVIAEAVMMIGVRVASNDVAITMAAQHGNHQLTTMLPLVGQLLVENSRLLAAAADHLRTRVIQGLEVNSEHLASVAARNPILATALNPLIGYERAAEIAHTALQRQVPILDVARELTDLDDATLRRLLDPLHMTRPGTPDAD